jgi:large subunit ribosomal protein L14e
VPKLPRAAGSTAIKAALEKAGTVAKWDKSAWAQKRAAAVARRGLSDFERFGVFLAKKQRRDAVRKSLAKKA